jgi:hypothetical protein
MENKNEGKNRTVSYCLFDSQPRRLMPVHTIKCVKWHNAGHWVNCEEIMEGHAVQQIMDDLSWEVR